MDKAIALRIRRRIRSCTACELHEGCSSPVPWSGPTPADVAVLGEAPGRTEDEKDKPFIGRAGQLLRRLLHESGFDPDDIAYMNTVSCWPKGTPRMPHIRACAHNRIDQIALTAPSRLILVGATALKVFNDNMKLSWVHGRPMYWKPPHATFNNRSVTLWPIYHPAFALRRPDYESVIKDSLTKLASFNPDEDWPEDCTVCGGELFRYDEHGVAFCMRHSQHQMTILPG